MEKSNGMEKSFKEAYGPWAMIAGGSEGIGGAFATEIAKNGINVVLIARRADVLAQKAAELTEQFSIEVKTILQDLADPNLVSELSKQTADIEIGLLVYNAAVASVGAFFAGSLEKEHAGIDVNCRGPLNLIYHYGKKMIERKQGGIVLMSSMAGMRGSPFHAHYAATKAYNIVLAEGLWYEFKPYNVDVLACIAGLTSSPEIMKAVKDQKMAQNVSFMTPAEVVGEAFDALGKQPSIITGKENRSGNEILESLPRNQAIEILAKHAVKHFLFGEIPEQLTSKLDE